MDNTLGKTNFTEGRILSPLIKFALPVLLSLLLQSLYSAVDLLIVGKFAGTADVSGVSTGGQFMYIMLSLLGGYAVAITVLMGQKLGEGDNAGVEKTLSAGIYFFAVSGIVITAAVVIFTDPIVKLMNAPEEAYSATFNYIRICGWGSVFIFAYNLIGSIFRGLGDAKTPLVTVSIACVVNIFGDLYMVRTLGMGAAGAAIATVGAQFISVVLSLIFISRKKLLPFFSFKKLSPDRSYIRRIIKIGTPISLQDVLVSVSFAVILVIVNSMGLIASAGMGVGEKLCSFIMLLPSACSQAMAAFVSQNAGAGKHERADKALKYMILCSLGASVILFWASFFHGDILSSIFTNEPEVIAAAADYLKAYAIDCLLTSFLFCFLGYYSGYARSTFVMLQGIFGAFCVRIPVAFIMSRSANPSLFKVGLSTPCSSVVQVILCLVYMRSMRKKLTLCEDMNISAD